MFSVKSAPAEFGVSVSLMYSLIAARKVRGERYGTGRGTIRIPRDALDEYRRACSVGQPPPPPGRRSNCGTSGCDPTGLPQGVPKVPVGHLFDALLAFIHALLSETARKERVVMARRILNQSWS